MTGLFDEIAETCGPELARALRRHFAGDVVYVPRDPRPGSSIARALGLDAARVLCQALGPGHLYVPVRGDSPAARAAAIGRLAARGVPPGEIARQVGCSRRTVERWLARRP